MVNLWFTYHISKTKINLKPFSFWSHTNVSQFSYFLLLVIFLFVNVYFFDYAYLI